MLEFLLHALTIFGAIVAIIMLLGLVAAAALVLEIMIRDIAQYYRNERENNKFFNKIEEYQNDFN